MLKSGSEPPHWNKGVRQTCARLHFANTRKKKGKMKQRTASPLLMHLFPSTPTHELCYGSKLFVSNVWTTG